jgi:hypothetical protein
MYNIKYRKKKKKNAGRSLNKFIYFGGSIGIIVKTKQKNGSGSRS